VNILGDRVLEQSAVGGVTVGTRLGLAEHIDDSKKVFQFVLDDSDKAAIASVQKKSRNLIDVFGDCGGEYRRRA